MVSSAHNKHLRLAGTADSMLSDAAVVSVSVQQIPLSDALPLFRSSSDARSSPVQNSVVLDSSPSAF